MAPSFCLAFFMSEASWFLEPKTAVIGAGCRSGSGCWVCSVLVGGVVASGTGLVGLRITDSSLGSTLVAS